MRRPLQQAVIAAFKVGGAATQRFAQAWRAELEPLDRVAKAVATPVSATRPSPTSTRAPVAPPTTPAPTHDVFISHASEDKDAIARPLCEALVKAGISVWFDETTLTLGDSLRRNIDRGLAHCRFGVVILSPSFFAKDWPQRELDGLVARETTSGRKAILPLWHKIDREAVTTFSPMLADRLAARTAEGLDNLVEAIRRALELPPEGRNPVAAFCSSCLSKCLRTTSQATGTEIAAAEKPQRALRGGSRQGVSECHKALERLLRSSIARSNSAACWQLCRRR